MLMKGLSPIAEKSKQQSSIFPSDAVNAYRARLRREVTCNIATQSELAKHGVHLNQRIEALDFRWLKKLFHSTDTVQNTLNIISVSHRSRTILQELDTQNTTAGPIRSEADLFELIYQLITVLTLSCSMPDNTRQKASRRKTWHQLMILMRAWEATLESQKDDGRAPRDYLK